MARLLREKGGPGDSNRASNGGSFRPPSEDLPSPYGELGCALSAAELRETAYEIFVAVCRTTGGKQLTYISQAERAAGGGTPERSLSSASSISPSFQKSLTSTAASKMKKALGLKSKKSPGKESSPSKSLKKPMTVGELVRVQMGISEQTDARIRRGLLRIAAGQVNWIYPFSSLSCEVYVRS